MGVSIHAKVREELLKVIDEATAPDKMSKQEAAELLGDLGAEIEVRLECLQEEIGTPSSHTPKDPRDDVDMSADYAFGYNWPKGGKP